MKTFLRLLAFLAVLAAYGVTGALFGFVATHSH